MDELEKTKQRLELLKMARELLNEEYINRRAEDHNKWLTDSDELWKTKRQKLAYPVFTTYPTEDEIIAKAAKLYEFVNRPESVQQESTPAASVLQPESAVEQAPVVAPSVVAPVPQAEPAPSIIATIPSIISTTIPQPIETLPSITKSTPVGPSHVESVWATYLAVNTGATSAAEQLVSAWQKPAAIVAPVAMPRLSSESVSQLIPDLNQYNNFISKGVT